MQAALTNISLPCCCRTHGMLTILSGQCKFAAALTCKHTSRRYSVIMAATNQHHVLLCYRRQPTASSSLLQQHVSCKEKAPSCSDRRHSRLPHVLCCSRNWLWPEVQAQCMWLICFKPPSSNQGCSSTMSSFTATCLKKQAWEKLYWQQDSCSPPRQFFRKTCPSFQTALFALLTSKLVEEVGWRGLGMLMFRLHWLDKTCNACT